MQRRGRQLGEIRIGVLAPTAKGKMAPSKIESFRFTTRSRQTAEFLAEQFSSTANAIELLNGEKTYEVLTKCTELPVMVPPGEQAISQWYEKWSGQGCERRCDSETEQLTQSPCKCPFDMDQRDELAAKGQACRPTTRVNLILPDVPDLGVWKLESHGRHAANELGSAAEILAAARQAGVVVPATLRLEQRQSKKVGEPTKQYAVPVLEINATLREMAGLDSSHGVVAALARPAQGQPIIEIGSGDPSDKKSAPASLAIETQSSISEESVTPLSVVELPTATSNTGSRMSELVTERTKSNLVGPQWAKFAAITLSRNVSMGENNFSEDEITRLLEAMRSSTIEA